MSLTRSKVHLTRSKVHLTRSKVHLTRSKVQLTRSKVQRLRDEVPKAAVEGSKRTHRHQGDQPHLLLSPFVHLLTCSHPHQQLLRHQGSGHPHLSSQET